MTPATKKPTAQALSARIEKSIENAFSKAKDAKERKDEAEAEAKRLHLLYQEKVRERLAREGVR